MRNISSSGLTRCSIPVDSEINKAAQSVCIHKKHHQNKVSPTEQLPRLSQKARKKACHENHISNQTNFLRNSLIKLMDTNRQIDLLSSAQSLKLPYKKFCKRLLQDGKKRKQNPESKTLLTFGVGIILYCPEGSISVGQKEVKNLNHFFGKIFKKTKINKNERKMRNIKRDIATYKGQITVNEGLQIKTLINTVKVGFFRELCEQEY